MKTEIHWGKPDATESKRLLPMQIHLINLFFAEAIAPRYPLNAADAGKMADYMEKLTALIK